MGADYKNAIDCNIIVFCTHHKNIMFYSRTISWLKKYKYMFMSSTPFRTSPFAHHFCQISIIMAMLARNVKQLNI